jgi:hypothetical protein
VEHHLTPSADYTTYSTNPFASSISFDVPVGTITVKDLMVVCLRFQMILRSCLEKLVVNVDLTNAKFLQREIVQPRPGGLEITP